MGIRSNVYRLIFFIGWILSPFTPWNDCIINVPLSFVLAVLFTSLVKTDFLTVMVIAYWLTNGVGLLLMYASGTSLLKKGEGVFKSLLKLIVTAVAYTIIMALVYRLGVLKLVSKSI